MQCWIKKISTVLIGAALSSGTMAAVPDLLWASGDSASVRLLREDGSLWALGYDDVSQKTLSAPKRLGDGFLQVAQGLGLTVGLRADGSLWGWGGAGLPDSRGARRLLEGVARLDSNGVSVAVLGRHGEVWAMGLVGKTSSTMMGGCVNSSPVIWETPQRLGQDMRDVRVGDDGVMALDTQGRLWGYRFYAALPAATRELALVGFDPAGAAWRGFDREVRGLNRVQAADGGWQLFPSVYGGGCFPSNNPPWQPSPTAAPADPIASRVYDGAVLWEGGSRGLSVSEPPLSYCRNQPGQPGYMKAGELAKVVSVANQGFMALRRDGALVGCGTAEAVPTDKPAVEWVHSPQALGGRYLSAHAGSRYTLALDERGVAWSWGRGSRLSRESPYLLPGADKVRVGDDFQSLTVVPMLAQDSFFSAGLKRDGSLWLWGGDRVDGGYKPMAPTRVDGERYRVVIGRRDGDNRHQLLAQHESGEWRVLSVDAFFDGDGQAVWQPFALQRFVDVSPTARVAIGEDGQIWTWGADGQGDYDGVADAAPRVWNGLGGQPPFAKVLMASWDRLAVLGKDGRLWLSKTESLAGVKRGQLLAAGTDFVDFRPFAGYHGQYDRQGLIGLKRDGSLLFWRSADDYPRLGEPEVLGRGFKAMSIGRLNLSSYSHLLLTRDDGELWGLGSNYYDQLGVGGAKLLTEPTPIALDGAAQLSAATSGALGLHRLEGRITPAVADLGRVGHYFVAATLKGVPGLFSFDGQSWRYSPDGQPLALAAAAKLADRRVEVLGGLDVKGLAGTELWLGYGIGDSMEAARAEMLARQRWQKVHTLQ